MTRPGFHKLRIVATDPFDIAVELDDRPIHPTRLILDLDTRDLPWVSIDLAVDRLEVTAEALAALSAYVLPSDPQPQPNPKIKRNLRHPEGTNE